MSPAFLPRSDTASARWSQNDPIPHRRRCDAPWGLYGPLNGISWSSAPRNILSDALEVEPLNHWVSNPIQPLVAIRGSAAPTPYPL